MKSRKPQKLVIDFFGDLNVTFSQFWNIWAPSNLTKKRKKEKTCTLAVRHPLFKRTTDE